MDTLEYISLREAAQELGITLRAVRGRVKSRNVPLVTVTSKHGDRYVLLREHLSMLGELPTDEPWTGSGTVPAPGANSTRSDWTLFKTVPGEGYKTTRPPQESDPETVTGNGDQRVSGNGDPTPSDTVPGDGSSGQTVPVKVHLAALETTRQAIESAREAHARADQAVLHAQQMERATWALQSELSNYRRALTDHAESLAEKEALSRQAAEQQALLAQLESQREEALQLLAEKTRHEEDKEREAERLAESLRQAESRVNKVPSWLRKLLGV